MSFFIAGQKIDKVSGPVTLAVIKPTQKLLRFLMTDDAPSILFLGDNHSGIDQRCDESKENIYQTFMQNRGLILKALGDTWYKALDKLAKNRPIDYHVEAFFPFKFLQKEEYLVLDRNNFYNVRESVMNYLPRKYLTCFSKRHNKKIHGCITDNIRYHLVDIRFSPTNFLLQGDDKIDKSEICYETEVIQNITCCALMAVEVLPLHKGSDKTAISLLKIAVESPIAFAESFYDLHNPYFITNSLILKQTRKFTRSKDARLVKNGDEGFYDIENPLAEEYRKFFVDYYRFYLEKILKNTFTKDLKDKVSECVYKFEEKMRHGAYVKAQELKLCGLVDFDLTQTYGSYIKQFLFYLFLPIMDIYFLFRSWKPIENMGWLSVFHAGDIHTTILRLFLVEKGYYTQEYLCNSNTRCLTLHDSKRTTDFHLDSLIPMPQLDLNPIIDPFVRDEILDLLNQ